MLSFRHMLFGIDAQFLNSVEKNRESVYFNALKSIREVFVKIYTNRVGRSKERESFDKMLICSRQSMNEIQFRSQRTLP